MTKFVVVEEILDQLESAKSGLVPESVTQAIVSGINNVPSQLIQPRAAAGGACYTTFPLSPIIKNCCIDKSYLNLEFDINFKITTEGLSEASNYRLPFYIGFRDSSSIFNQLQILLENSVLYNTTYHREESLVSYNSLPETEIRGNNQYASIEKLKGNKYCPMKRIVIQETGATLNGGVNKTIHYKLTVDLNRLCPILSNIHFTTPHFGNLKLKVWIQRIQEAMFICPDYGYYIYTSTGQQPIQNAYWQFYPLAPILTQKIASSVIPFYAYNRSSNKIDLATSVTIGFSDSFFMSFQSGVAEIVQTCFDITEDEYKRLTNHFEDLGVIILPTQTWDSGVFNNSNIQAGDNWPASQIGSIGGFNVNFVSTWSHPQTQSTCFQNEMLQNIQLLIDGRPINSLPYSYVNDKCIVDCTQAIIDTDHEEINHDYIQSLTFGNETDDSSYVENPIQDYYSTGELTKSIGRGTIEQPNSFMLNFSTNLPDAFHSGFCVLENSNRAGILRFNSTSACDTVAGLKNTENKTGQFPIMLNHQSNKNIPFLGESSSSTVGYSCFCDCCLVLNYDKNRGKCFDGQLSWASPFNPQ